MTEQVEEAEAGERAACSQRAVEGGHYRGPTERCRVWSEEDGGGGTLRPTEGWGGLVPHVEPPSH